MVLLFSRGGSLHLEWEEYKVTDFSTLLVSQRPRRLGSLTFWDGKPPGAPFKVESQNVNRQISARHYWHNCTVKPRPTACSVCHAMPFGSTSQNRSERSETAPHLSESVLSSRTGFLCSGCLVNSKFRPTSDLIKLISYPLRRHSTTSLRPPCLQMIDISVPRTPLRRKLKMCRFGGFRLWNLAEP